MPPELGILCRDEATADRSVWSLVSFACSRLQRGQEDGVYRDAKPSILYRKVSFFSRSIYVFTSNSW